MDHSDLVQKLAAAADELGSAVMSLLRRWKDQKPPALTLFHFTDCSGLVGIVTERTLHASLATSLNDASETKYAISRLRATLEAGSLTFKHLQAHALLKHTEERHVGSNYRAYVCSFCGAAEAVHWLHYGGSGTGVAVGFDSIGLYAVDQFILHPVIYDVEEQDRLTSAIIRLADDCAEQFSSQRDENIDAFFAQLAVSYVELAAPRMKDPAFKAENEWRLTSTEVWTKDDEVQNPTRKDPLSSGEWPGCA